MNPRTAAHFYFVAAREDEEDGFISLFQASQHRLQRGKRPLVPLFADQQARSRFHRRALSLRTHLQRRLRTYRHRSADPGHALLQTQLRVARHMVRRSWGGVLGTGAGARDSTRFPSAPLPSPRVYVAGHGAPGSGFLGATASASAETIAKQLIAMGLPASSEVRVDACHGAAGRWPPLGGPQRTLAPFGSGSLASAANPAESFAARLHAELRSRGFSGRTAGYLGQLGSKAVPVVQRDGATGVHMATDLNGHGAWVRRSHTRITFG